eukprot:3358279-Karenia_brevis.AAC.1
MGDSESDESLSPILDAEATLHQWVAAEVLQSKGGAHQCSVDTLVRMVVARGYHKLIIKSDQEPAIKALIADARKKLAELKRDVQ